MTLSPPAASRRAIARPMPRFPPVTSDGSAHLQATSGCLDHGLRSQDERCRLPWPIPQTRHPRRSIPEFTAYPLRRAGRRRAAAAAELGAEHADFRAERIRGQRIGLSDGSLETLCDTDDLGLAVRVVVDGTWGFAATVDLTPDAAARAAAQAAVDVARVAAAVNAERIELADEPAHGEVSWVSAYEVDPFDVSVADKIALLAEWSSELLARDGIDHVDAVAAAGQECKFYCDGATTATQQRVRLHPSVTAVAVEPDGRFETMRTLAPPVGRGYEYPGRHRLGLRGRAGRDARSCWRRSWPRPRSSRAATTW